MDADHFVLCSSGPRALYHDTNGRLAGKFVLTALLAVIWFRCTNSITGKMIGSVIQN